MGAERYEIKELPTNVSAAMAAAVDAGTLALSGDLLTYEFALPAVNVVAFVAGAAVGGPKSDAGKVEELTDEKAAGLLEVIKTNEANPEVKTAIPPALLISLGIWIAKKLIERFSK